MPVFARCEITIAKRIPSMLQIIERGIIFFVSSLFSSWVNVFLIILN